jgi:hypothetical protein
MPNAWNALVKEKFKLGRLGNPAYSLGEAMKSAKKVYKKGSQLIQSLRKKRRGGSRKNRTKKQAGKCAENKK